MKTIATSCFALGTILGVVSCAGSGPSAGGGFDFPASSTRCATPEPSAAIQARVEMDLIAAPTRAVAAVEIPVSFHIIANGETPAEGMVTPAMVDAQIEKLNAAYASTNFRFVLAGGLFTATINPEWFEATPGSKAELDMKASFRTVGANAKSALHIYSTNASSGELGWATFPWDAATNLTLDGVVINFGTLPGSTHPTNNQGDTLVHEVGHWLGLYHTFQGGCSAKNDYVKDTPAEAAAATDCPVGRDTCTKKNQAGLDPVNNYMNLSDDECMLEFTAGQSTRMDSSFSRYRL